MGFALGTAPMLVLASLAATGQGGAEVQVTFSREAHRHLVSGFGGEWDPHFWCKPNTRRGCDEAAWQAVCGRIRDIGIGRVRMMVRPDWYEPENDNDDPNVINDAAFTWDSEPMRSMLRHLDFCQEAGIRVTLTWWCAPIQRQSDGQPYWLASKGVTEWCSAPNDPAECAENVAALLMYLLDKRGYACIDAFTFYNEPDWAFFREGGTGDFAYYETNCRAIQERLVRMGLRSKLSLDLADASVHRGWLEQSTAALGDIADRYNAHSYVFSCEDEDYPRKIREWVRQRVTWCGDKPFATNELGTRHYKGAYSATDVDTFERAFLVAQYAILGLSEGMTGALFWGLYDQYYYDGDPEDGSNGGMMKTNLMAYVTEGWRVRPTGQAWTLICHGAPRGSRIYPAQSSSSEVDAVALAAPDGVARVLLVNRARESSLVTLKGVPGATASATLRGFTRSGLGEATPVRAEEGTLRIEAPAESIVLVDFSQGS